MDLVFCYSRNHLKMHQQMYEVVTYKILITLNSCIKHKILIFFTVVDWDSMGRVIEQTGGQDF